MTDRKKDHIELAIKSYPDNNQPDPRFFYEPLMSAHPGELPEPFPFLKKMMRVPIWVSSMTGGSERSRFINENLARACNKYGMGMGLGSCRSLLKSEKCYHDFNIRDIIGDELPLYANLGIREVEEAIATRKAISIHHLIDKLNADGLIIHINPTQEWLQPEGERQKNQGIDSIRKAIDIFDFPIIVKEVGQGIGPESLRELLRMPIEAIELGAFGGANFASLELMRQKNKQYSEHLQPLATIGHNAEQMIEWINELFEWEEEVNCRQVIISGGISNFLDGYYFTEKCLVPSIYGQASQLLQYANESYQMLDEYLDAQIKGLQFAKSFLRVRKY